jgi:hypothetical protein
MANMTPYEALQISKSLKKRSRKLEKLIIENPQLCFDYAREVLRGPFSEGEKMISSDPFHSYMYAKYVLNGPFHLGHTIIFNSFYKKDYIDFLKSLNYDLTEISEWLI